VGNVGDNSASSYRVHASETQQLSYLPMVDATPICTCVELLGQSRQPMTGRLATHPSNAAVNRYAIILWRRFTDGVTAAETARC